MNPKDKLKAVLASMLALVEAVKKENRGLNAEEVVKYDAFDAEAKGLEKLIEADEKNAAITAKLADENNPVTEPIFAAGTKQKKWGSMGEMLVAVRTASTPGGAIDGRLLDGVKAAGTGLNEQINSEGGFMVEQDFVTDLLKNTYETSVIASRCRRIPIGANSNGIRMNGVDETSRANGSRFGGVQAYWTGEAATVTATKPKFKEINLKLEKLMALCYATDELLADSTALDSVIRSAFSEEFAFKLDDAIINGTGVGQPLGILASPSLVTVAKEANQVAATFVYENIVKMWSRMWARSRQNAIWAINQDVEPQLYSLTIGIGTAGQPAYLPPGGLSGNPYATLFGRPVIAVEQAATMGTVGDIMLIDPSQYLLIDKGGVVPSVSVHVRFLYDEQVFRFTYRVNGAPIWSSALTPFKGAANTQSPFVALATRS